MDSLFDHSLVDIVDRTRPPAPWMEGDNIPWDDPGFSERMLAFHLAPDQDLASRRPTTIASHIDTIAALVPAGGRVLDLACGPGLYAHELARRGYECHGIDFGPASIAHARAVAAAEGLGCTFEQADLRTAAFGGPWDLVMMIFGQINVFRREEAREILWRARDALTPGGVLLLEPETEASTRATVKAEPTWSASRSGLFSDRPHVLLEESAWDEEERTATHRWHVIDVETAKVTRHAMSTCAYAAGEVEGILADLGFDRIETADSLAADPGLAMEQMFVVTGSCPT